MFNINIVQLQAKVDISTHCLEAGNQTPKTPVRPDASLFSTFASGLAAVSASTGSQLFRPASTTHGSKVCRPIQQKEKKKGGQSSGEDSKPRHSDSELTPEVEVGRENKKKERYKAKAVFVAPFLDRTKWRFGEGKKTRENSGEREKNEKVFFFIYV